MFRLRLRSLFRKRAVETVQDDVTPGGHPVVILSHGYWQRRFSGDPGILNQQVLVSGNPMTVIGVAPRGFHGACVGRSFDVMTPIMMKAQVTPSWDDLNRRRSLWLWLAAAVFCVKTQRDPAAVTNLLRRELQNADPRLTLYDAKTLEQAIGEQLYIDRLLAWLSTAFGLLATLLAAIGVYGVLAYNVTRRTREFGIRMALGARSRSISWLVLREVAVLLALGAALAIPTSYALSRFVESRLFGVSRNDPVLVLVATLLLVLTGLAAGSIPALRAARVQPTQALRSE